MKKLVIASVRPDAGKTSVIVGLAMASGTKFGYLKPFGDRLLYRKKRLWDYDSAVCTTAMGSDEAPESMSLGFDHSKLRYMYDREGTRKKLDELLALNSEGKEAILVEGGRDLVRGVSVYLDSLSLCDHLKADLAMVLSGGYDQICDDSAFIRKQLDLSGVNLRGIIVNKVRDLDDFQEVNQEHFQAMDLPVLGVLPFREELTFPTMRFIHDVLFAKVLSGEANLDNLVKHVFVGAMSADAVMRVQRFRKTDKLVITSGDRSDMVLAALETDAAGIILTNNILPPANIIARASERDIPMLLVPKDTFQTAKKIDDLIPLLGKEEKGKMELLGDLAGDHLDIDAILN